MKPNFALTLSFEGIDLLHRVPTGWHLVGSARFDDADLTGALAALREAAFALEPDGLTTKLVLPEDQIKYLDVDIAGTGPEGYEALAHKAMEGATPYDLSELAIDWAEKDGRLHVAAVARETLAEAESFAHEHQFNPVSFVAQPAEGAFEGEPFFGGTHAATELFGGPVTPDRDPIKVVGKAQPPEPEAAPEPEPQPDPEPAAKEPEPAPLIEEISVPSFAIIDAPEKAPKAAPEAPSEPEDYEEAARLAEQELGPGRDLTPEEEEMLKAFEAKEAEPPAQPDLPLAPPPAPAAEPAAVKKPAPEAKQAADAPAPSFSTVRAKRDTAPASAPPLKGAQRGHSGASPAPAPEAPAPKPFDPIPVAETRADDPEAAMLDMADSLRPADVQAPEDGARGSLLGRLKRSKPAAPEAEAERLTVFGARDSKSIGGKPRFMGLVLTALLLVFLVIMAAWASLGSEGVASLLGGDGPDSIAEALPSGTDADSITEEELAEAGTPATASTEPPLEQAIALPAPEPEAELEPEPELAEAPDTAAAPTLQDTEERYATTGIWQSAPQKPALPGTSVLDDLYVASIDHPVLAVDAVALPDPQKMDGDAALAQPADPAAAGTRFDFDPRGLVKASPDGSMSPDGILIYSGKPPVIPPKWPEREESSSETNALDTTRLAAMRPKPRPDDLIEQTERSNLGGRTRVELAALRPQLRPASAQEQAAADEKPTQQAVAASLKPRNRPDNFAAIVASAEQQPEPELPTGSIFQQATVQPVQPALPSKASVARQATITNQINLRKINLIGVYGQPNDRRALVRLSSGRYKKVQVGDRIDGGKVAAIGDGELSYVKSGRTVTLKMPKG